MADADRALYRAKAQGRDRTVVAHWARAGAVDLPADLLLSVDHPVARLSTAGLRAAADR